MRFIQPLSTAGALALGLLALPAAAQDAAPPSDVDFGDTITVAGAAAIVPDYDGSDDYRIVPAPAAIGSVGGVSFSLVGTRFSADLIPNRPGPGWDFQAGPVVNVYLNRNDRDSIDDARVAALPDRKIAIELGGYVGIGKVGVITSPYDRIAVSLSYRHDVNNAHDSGIWQPSVTYFTPLSRKAGVGLFASAERVSRRFGRYYYSVNAAQSVSTGLPAFAAGSGWKNYSLGIAGTYSLTGDLLGGWKAIAGVNYRRLLNDYGDSPLVSVAGSRSQWIGALGIGYTF